MLGARELRVVAHVAAEVDDPHLRELALHHLAEAVVGGLGEGLATGDEGDHPVVLQPVGRPAEEARVHVVHAVLVLRRAFLDVGALDPLVHAAVGAVGVVLVVVLLPGVVWRVADDDADLAGVLALHPLDVLVRNRPEHVVLVTGEDAERRHVVQRVHEAQAGELGVFALDGGVGGLDVQVGHVVGQDRHLVGVQLVQVLGLQLLGPPAEVFEQLDDEGARAGGGVEDLDAPVDQALAEVLLAQPVG